MHCSLSLCPSPVGRGMSFLTVGVISVAAGVHTRIGRPQYVALPVRIARFRARLRDLFLILCAEGLKVKGLASPTFAAEATSSRSGETRETLTPDACERPFAVCVSSTARTWDRAEHESRVVVVSTRSSHSGTASSSGGLVDRKFSCKVCMTCNDSAQSFR